MQIKNLFLALVTSSIWGSSFLMIKYSLDELNPSDIALYRILIGALFVNIFVRTKEKIDKADHIKFVIVSFFWMALPFYMFGIAEQTITSSLAGLINGSTPIFVAFIAVVFYRLRITNLQIIYIFSGFIGVGLITLSGGINDLSFVSLYFTLAFCIFVFSSTFLRIFNIAYISKLSARVNIDISNLIFKFPYLITNSKIK